MDGEKRRAEPCRLRRGALDGVGDVVELEVEKDPLARRGEPACQRKPIPAVGELHADLIEGRRIADPLDEALGLADIGDVESDDESVTRRRRPHRSSWSERPGGVLRLLS